MLAAPFALYPPSPSRRRCASGWRGATAFRGACCPWPRSCRGGPRPRAAFAPRLTTAFPPGLSAVSPHRVRAGQPQARAGCACRPASSRRPLSRRARRCPAFASPGRSPAARPLRPPPHSVSLPPPSARPRRAARTRRRGRLPSLSPARRVRIGRPRARVSRLRGCIGCAFRVVPSASARVRLRVGSASRSGAMGPRLERRVVLGRVLVEGGCRPRPAFAPVSRKPASADPPPRWLPACRRRHPSLPRPPSSPGRRSASPCFGRLVSPQAAWRPVCGGGIGRSESGALRGSRRKMATCFEIPRVNPRGGRPPGPCVSFGTKNGAFVTLVRVGDLTKAASASEFRSKWPENGKSSARRGAGGAAPAALAAPRLRAGSPLAPSSSRCPALAPPGRSLAARAFNGAFPLRIAAVRPLAARPPAPRGRGAGSAAALAARAPRLGRGRLSSSPPRAFAKASREEPRPLPRARAFRPQPCRPGPQRCFCAARGRAPPSGASRSMLLPRALSFSRPGGKCPLFWRANTVLQPFPVGFGFLLRRKSHLSQRRPAKTPGSHLAASPCAWKNVAEPCLLATKGASFAPAPSVALTFTSVGSAPSPRLERP